MNAEKGWAFIRQFGSKPIFLAPMVEMNDLAFRLLVRQYGISCCWTGMLNSFQWNSSESYRLQSLQTCPEDRPLVAQIAGSIDSNLVSAGLSVSTHCDMVDINLGCCQRVARRGQYGYFLVDNDKKRIDVLKIVRELSSSIKIPLSVKVRILADDNGNPSIENTVNFCKSLQDSGASVVTIHGRPASQDKSGDVNINAIKAVVQALSIPVIANGGIKSLNDCDKIIAETNAAGVMVGQVLLYHPTIFSSNNSDKDLPSFVFAQQYFDLFKKYGGNFDNARKHMFYFFEKELGNNSEAKKRLGTSQNNEEIEAFIQFVKDGGLKQ